ncbi:1-deoxy-D-xylulose-5-phosphate synthase [Agrococcus sp. Marseille-Q4369]|uniref:1-deoxy-D-xylulose-5-phosphate synthase n=1 Tax=Agrococcus sp. Marseille-Q4369 TaxID=2810513 RepID=UPI001B8CDCAB|nr:1-deoxy-D-xylulose-5-phosphate synthase [Agrococcus sp. Marseille-Q4369]QUW19147.1 1-deoxy-D-xylulose-5-phosphate synthase [Agrococcus sp. Marseille-Q4369]
MALLDQIHGPRDLDRLSQTELTELAGEIRAFLIREVARTGGHLGPNLGVVELTMAMHRVFHSPRDAFVFDTGHQSYVHKLLTGRQDFSRLRQKGGLAGYPQRAESEHDIVESSHASSSLSWAEGISRAFDITGQHDRSVVAVVGDGALTGGMTWEALNNISDDNSRRLVIVVNDNGRSYAPTIGGMARFLNGVRTRRSYANLRTSSERAFAKLGRPGRAVYRGVRGATHGFLTRFVNNEALYSNLDIKYLGPIDGHDLEALEEALTQARDFGAPVIVHVITQKGQGFDPAIRDEADQFHAVGQIDPETGESLSSAGRPAWTSVFAEELVSLAKQDERIVGITAAMLRPTGLDRLAAYDASRVLDVGIAEQHAVTTAAGLAYGGLHPVVAIYATFVNRAFDQVLMDVALHKAGVTFVLDRAGVTGPDGPSHHGMWDLALLQFVPGIRLAAPRDAARLQEELREAVAVQDAPTVVRYPKGSVPNEIEAVRRTADGVDLLLEAPHRDVLIIAIGSFAHLAMEVAQRVQAQGIGVTVVDPRWVVPVAPSIVELARDHRIVITLEDGVRVGGIGTRVRQELRAAGVDTPVDELGLPDAFIDHAERSEILEEVGLSAQTIARNVIQQVLGTGRVPVARPLPEDRPLVLEADDAASAPHPGTVAD